jgi:hypothetical protein
MDSKPFLPPIVDSDEERFLGCLGRVLVAIFCAVMTVPAVLKLVGIIIWPWGLVVLLTLVLILLFVGLVVVLFY